MSCVDHTKHHCYRKTRAQEAAMQAHPSSYICFLSFSTKKKEKKNKIQKPDSLSTSERN